MELLDDYERLARIGALERSILQTWRRIADQAERHERIDGLLREISELEHRVQQMRAA